MLKWMRLISFTIGLKSISIHLRTNRLYDKIRLYTNNREVFQSLWQRSQDLDKALCNAMQDLKRNEYSKRKNIVGKPLNIRICPQRFYIFQAKKNENAKG